MLFENITTARYNDPHAGKRQRLAEAVGALRETGYPVHATDSARVSETVQEAKRKTPKVVKDALKAWRLYLGSVDKVRPKQEEILYARAVKAVSKAAKKLKFPYVAVMDQVDAKARELGGIMPRVGQDI